MKKRTRVLLAVTLGVVPLGVAWLWHPVCLPLTDEQLGQFNVPIEQRTDRDVFGRIFQRKGTQWYQCKSWVSRQFFF